MALKESSVLTNDGRAVLSFDPNNPSIAPTVTVDGSTYTQGVDVLFASSDGSIWSGEQPGSGMTASAGSQLRSQMGNIINNNDVSDATIEEWGANVNGANTKLNDGGDTEGGKDKGMSITEGVNTDLENAMLDSVKDASVAKARQSYANLRYPLAQLSDDVDFMKIAMKDYIPGKFQNGRKNRASERSMRTLGTVILPIPPGLGDSNVTNWGESSMNSLQLAGARGALDAMGKNTFGEFAGSVGTTVSSMINTASEDGGALGAYAKTALLSQIGFLGNNTAQLLARSQGQVINPNLELLFTGPARRSFNYTFRLTARSEKETIRIRKIIRFFKQGMSAKQSAGSALYLDTPNVFDVSFHAGSKEHPFIFKMKRTAITGFTVNYVPDGTYMTLPNKSMTAYEIGMSMQELDPIFDQDYTDLDGNNDSMIGY